MAPPKRLEWLVVFPFRMQGSQRLNPVTARGERVLSSSAAGHPTVFSDPQRFGIFPGDAVSKKKKTPQKNPQKSPEFRRGAGVVEFHCYAINFSDWGREIVIDVKLAMM